MTSGLLRVKDVQRLLSLGATSVYALIERGQLPVVRVGRSIRVRPEALEAFVEANTTAPPRVKQPRPRPLRPRPSVRNHLSV
jgi:excisionase family DNA binding protein